MVFGEGMASYWLQHLWAEFALKSGGMYLTCSQVETFSFGKKFDTSGFLENMAKAKSIDWRSETILLVVEKYHMQMWTPLLDVGFLKFVLIYFEFLGTFKRGYSFKFGSEIYEQKGVGSGFWEGTGIVLKQTRLQYPLWDHRMLVFLWDQYKYLYLPLRTCVFKKYVFCSKCGIWDSNVNLIAQGGEYQKQVPLGRKMIMEKGKLHIHSIQKKCFFLVFF